jgi:hypothetical protein
MKKTGTPVSATPFEKIQGYIDFMGDKDPQSEDEIYMSGYNLAKEVKDGKAKAPIWAS